MSTTTIPVRGQRQPEAGHPRPAGPGGRGQPGHLGVDGVSAVRVGRRVELTVEAADEAAARAIVERLAGELLCNPLIESYAVELIGATSSTVESGVRFADGRSR